MERMIIYNMKLNKRAYVRPEILVELIKCWNPDWQKKHFSYNKDLLLLKVSGSQLRILAGNTTGSFKESS